MDRVVKAALVLPPVVCPVRLNNGASQGCDGVPPVEPAPSPLDVVRDWEQRLQEHVEHSVAPNPLRAVCVPTFAGLRCLARRGPQRRVHGHLIQEQLQRLLVRGRHDQCTAAEQHMRLGVVPAGVGADGPTGIPSVAPGAGPAQERSLQPAPDLACAVAAPLLSRAQVEGGAPGPVQHCHGRLPVDESLADLLLDEGVIRLPQAPAARTLPHECVREAAPVDPEGVADDSGVARGHGGFEYGNGVGDEGESDFVCGPSPPLEAGPRPSAIRGTIVEAVALWVGGRLGPTPAGGAAYGIQTRGGAAIAAPHHLEEERGHLAHGAADCDVVVAAALAVRLPKIKAHLMAWGSGEGGEGQAWGTGEGDGGLARGIGE